MYVWFFVLDMCGVCFVNIFGVLFIIYCILVCRFWLCLVVLVGYIVLLGVVGWCVFIVFFISVWFWVFGW